MKPAFWKEFLLPGSLSILVHSFLLLPLIFLVHAPHSSFFIPAGNVAPGSGPLGLPVIELQEEGEWQEVPPAAPKKVPVPAPPAPAPVAQPLQPSSMPPAAASEGGEYLSIGQVGQKPRFKVKVIPDYPEAAKRANIEGVVILQVDIDASGAVKKVGLVKGLGYGCDEAAIDALKRSVLTPAYLGAQAVPVRQMMLKYNFHFDY